MLYCTVDLIVLSFDGRRLLESSSVSSQVMCRSFVMALRWCFGLNFALGLGGVWWWRCGGRRRRRRWPMFVLLIRVWCRRWYGLPLWRASGSRHDGLKDDTGQVMRVQSRPTTRNQARVRSGSSSMCSTTKVCAVEMKETRATEVRRLSVVEKFFGFECSWCCVCSCGVSRGPTRSGA